MSSFFLYENVLRSFFILSSTYLRNLLAKEHRNKSCTLYFGEINYWTTTEEFVRDLDDLK